MKSEPIRFADLEKLLIALGFQPVQQPNYSIFRHPVTEAMISLPKYDAATPVQLLHLQLTRRILDTYGLMSPAAFDGFAEKVPA
jgi:hypothetical protein